jgi:hypothetical protein
MPTDRWNIDRLAQRRAILAIVTAVVVGAGFAAVRAQAPAETSESAPAATPATEAPAAPAAAATPAPATAPTDAAAAKPKAEPAPALTPYSVLVRLHMPVDAQVNAAFRDRLLTSTAAELRTAMGQMWETDVTFVVDGRSATAETLASIDPAALTEEFKEAGYDKVFLGGVRLAGSQWSIAAREWDAASQSAGPVHSESTFDARNLPALTAAVIQQAFRPIARIELVEGSLVITSIRGGEFPPGDPAAVPFEPGDLLTPFVLYYNRERVLQQIRDLPWTYLRVKSVERARMECETVSAYKTPLSGSRRRMELMAIAARPTFSSTRLIIAPRGNAADPLPGCRVELLDRLPTAEDPVADRQQLLTDRRGSIVVNVDPEHPLRHVLVHSGKSILGRVPFIPGMAETVTLAIPDDAARLSVEGALSVLEGELIDAVARRAVLMARARRAAKARKWEDVDKFVEQLQTVPDYEKFRERVMAVQLPAVQAAKDQNDRVAESRIKKMCADVQQSAAGHLDADKLREFRIEMAELKQAAK